MLGFKLMYIVIYLLYISKYIKHCIVVAIIPEIAIMHTQK